MSANLYTDRQYDVRLLLAAPDAPSIWEYSIWQSLVSDLTPLLSSTRGRTSLRMMQLDRRNSGLPNQSYVRFGPLGWNDKAHRKWTHNSNDAASESKHWDFCAFSAWAPGPSKCNECPPDGYMVIRKESTSRFSYSVLIAIGNDLADSEITMSQAMNALQSKIPSVLLAKTQRSWARAGIGSACSLADCEIFGAPFKPGLQSVSLNMLAGDWRTYQQIET